mmetsp:Transcript_66672/g.139191  ORF Transcript_66672/g.139191 Transcript_66672/m.139191 type:complete len:80 (-) Transcript_66672:65-304(-)
MQVSVSDTPFALVGWAALGGALGAGLHSAKKDEEEEEEELPGHVWCSLACTRRIVKPVAATQASRGIEDFGKKQLHSLL